MIQIGEQCTQAVNPNNSNCQVTSNLFQIKQGQSQVVSINQLGLVSSAFYVSAYQKPDGTWVQTGGYNGQAPHTYATKVEPTWQPVAPEQYSGVM